ncbi:MAG: hypothetical protein AB7U82_01435 [Blastocatellales bacterium]
MGNRGRRGILFCLLTPLAILAFAYVWLAIDHGAPWLWEVNVHESGRYTLRETIFYFNHFLREIPVDVGMALFLIAGFMNSREIIPNKSPELRGSAINAARWAWPLLAAAAGLIVVAFMMTASRQGWASAALDLLQFRTRDYLSEYGSHWRFHWLSTLWFGVAAMLGAPLIAWLCGQARRDQQGHKLLLAAWGYFAALTVVFWFSSETFTDVRYTGHQAREILTHGPVTYLLTFGALHLLAARLPEPFSAKPSRTPVIKPFGGYLQLALFLLIPIYLAVVTLSGDVLEAGQSERGLAAMVGAHFFEHVLDYLLVVLLATGGYALLSARRFQDKASA